MAVNYAVADCPACGFPISGQPGKAISCPSCGISGSITGVTIPTTLFWGVIAFVAGVMVSPQVKRQLGKIS